MRVLGQMTNFVVAQIGQQLRLWVFSVVIWGSMVGLFGEIGVAPFSPPTLTIERVVTMTRRTGEKINSCTISTSEDAGHT